MKGDPYLHTALIAQSKRGNDGVAICTLLITHGASPNEHNGEALQNAAKLNAVALLKAMLQGQVVPNATLSRVFTLANHQQIEIVEIFLRAGLRGEPLHTALV